jgi:MYXO-CTERM domain-containing protein
MQRSFLTMVVCCAGLASASSINFSFTNGTNTNGTYGNQRTYSAGGVTVTVTAWGVTGNSETTFQTAHVGQYNGLGLGACNQLEGSLDCNDPNHQVDNAGQFDFMMFQFTSTATGNAINVNMASILLNEYCGSGCPAGGWDRDMSYWVGTAANGLNLAGKNPSVSSQLTALGFGGVTNIDNPAATSGGVTDNLSGSGNTLLVAARFFPGSTQGDGFDRFKIGDVIVNTTTPEPAPFGWAGLALVGLGLVRRKKRA